MRQSRQSIPVGPGNASKRGPLPPPCVVVPELFIAFAGARGMTVPKSKREGSVSCPVPNIAPPNTRNLSAKISRCRIGKGPNGCKAMIGRFLDRDHRQQV
jgi:hypothetical protein